LGAMRSCFRKWNGAKVQAGVSVRSTGAAELEVGKAVPMLVGKILVVINVSWLLVNLFLTYLNWRVRANSRNEQFRLLDEAIRFRQEGMEFLKRAKSAADTPDAEFKVCSECHNIRSRWIVSDTGSIVCIGCAVDFAAKE